MKRIRYIVEFKAEAVKQVTERHGFSATYEQFSTGAQGILRGTAKPLSSTR